MTRRYIYTAALLLLTVVGLASCRKAIGDQPSLEHQGDYLLQMDFETANSEYLKALPTAQRLDGWNENLIEHLHLLIYEGETQKAYFTNKPKTASSFDQPLQVSSLLDERKGTMTAVIPRSEGTNPLAGRRLKIIVIANYRGNVSLMGKTLTQLRNQRVDEATIKEQLMGNPTAAQPSFLMDGELQEQTLTWPAQNNTLRLPSTIELKRAVSRVELIIPKVEVKDANGKAFTMVGVPEATLYNGSSVTTLTAEKPWQEVNADHSLPRETYTAAAYRPMITSSEGYALQYPFYTSQDEFKKYGGGSDMNRVQISIKIKLKDPLGNQKDYYYTLPIYYLAEYPGMSAEEKAEVGRIGRNRAYKVYSTITELGDVEPGAPRELDSFFSVEDWDTPPYAVNGDMPTAHYLVVRERAVDVFYSRMSNSSPRQMLERDIEYLSDLPLDVAALNTFEVVYTGYNSNGNPVEDKGNKTTLNGKQNGIFSAINVTEYKKEGKKFIKITAPVPDNYVPWTVTIPVKQLELGNPTPLQETVAVTLYPPVYVTAEKSTGMTTDAGYNALYWYNSFGALSDTTPQMINTLYRVHTTIPVTISGVTYYVGDPTGSDGATGRDAESNKIISPEFIIASHYGVSNRTAQYGDAGGFWSIDVISDKAINDSHSKWYKVYSNEYIRYNEYTNAGERARTYFEDRYGWKGTHTKIRATGKIDSKGDINRHANAVSENFQISRTRIPKGKAANSEKEVLDGRWRLPTTAELNLIQEIQSDPKSAVRSLLLGDNYWAAETGKKVFMGSGKPAADPNTRPVFDTYKHPNN